MTDTGFRLSNDQQQKLRECFDDSRIKAKHDFKDIFAGFVESIECSCDWFLSVKAAPGMTEHRQNLSDMLKSFKETHRHLRAMLTGEVNIFYARNLSGYRTGKEDDLMLGAEVINTFASLRLQNTCDGIRTLINFTEHAITEETKRDKGSPTKKTTIFISDVARSYKKWFGVLPTNEADQPLSLIVERLFEILGESYKDNSRAIAKAIKSLRS